MKLEFKWLSWGIFLISKLKAKTFLNNRVNDKLHS